MIHEPSALPTSCNESGITVTFTTLDMNSQMHSGGSAGDRVREQTTHRLTNRGPSILMGGASSINLQQQNHGFVPHQMNFSASTSSNVCYPSVVPLATPRVLGVPINYGLPHHLLPSYSNMPVYGDFSEDIASNHFEESSGSSYSGKNAESSAGSSYFHHYESTSDSVNAPNDSMHLYYGHSPRYVGGNGFLPIEIDNDDWDLRVRSRAAGLNTINHSNYNGFAHGVNGTESFQPASVFPSIQTVVANPLVGPVGCLAWSHSPTIPFMLGHGDRNLQQLHQMQSMRDHRFQFRPQVPAPPLPLPSGAIPLYGPVGPRPRVSSRRIRIGVNQPQMRSVPETMQIRSGFPYLRYVDEVAIIDLPEHHNDRHNDMRMDIEHMSYEELLVLGEHIGNINTGLSEESITNQLRTRLYELPSSRDDAEESQRLDEEAASCIICLGDYQDQEELGCLDCGHDYHADCLRKWMLVKNVCPICKARALSS